MQMTRSIKLPSDRTMSRAIVPMAAILVVGAVLLGVLYFLDQYRDSGPSLPDRAIQAAEDAVRANPNSINARFALAEYYSNAGRPQDAIAQYDEILKAQPKAVAVLLARGRAELAVKQTDPARKDFQAVVDVLKTTETAGSNQDLEAAYYELGSLALAEGQSGQAVDLLTSAIKISRTDADALYQLGNALIATGDAATARDSLLSAVDLVPTDWCDPYASLSKAFALLKDGPGGGWADGMTALCQKKYDAATTLLTSAASGTYAVRAFIGLGLMAETRGDYAGAHDAYTKALAKDPKNFLATTGLARVNSATIPAASSAPSATGGN
jgi:tetratricopeptide (TPR) repeat protein